MVKYFDRYVLREVAAPFGIGLLVYSFVLLMNQLLLFPELFIARGVPLSTSLRLLFDLIPAILAFTIPMSVLMGVLAGLSRLSSDAEITAFKTLGIGHLRLLRPLLIFAFGGWIVTSVLALWIAPAYNSKWVQAMTEAAAERIQIQIEPREFNDSLPGTTIYFQDVGPTRDWANVFMYSSSDPMQPRLLLARRGRLNVSTRSKRAVLELRDVVEHDVALADPDRYSVGLYSRTEEEISAETVFGPSSAVKRVREMDIGELTAGLKASRARLADLRLLGGNLAARSSPANALARAENIVAQSRLRYEIQSHEVEIHKKLALPFACWIFVFFGLPLGISTKKGGRTSGFTLSLVIILVYYILITAGEKFAMDGRIPPWFGIWAANIGFALLGARLFSRSAREIPFFAALAVRRRGGRRPDEASAPASAAVRPSRRRMVLLRWPNILDRYILRKYLGISAFVMASFLAISAIVTFFEQIDNIYRFHKPISMLLAYVWYRMPEFIHFGIPVTALTATLLTFGFLTKSNELTAMKSCGISLYRAVFPALVMGCLLGFLTFEIQERILPRSSRLTQEAWDRLNDVPVQAAGLNSRRWVVNRTRDRIFYYRYFDARTAAMSELSIFDIDPARWTITRRFYARQAQLQGDELYLSNGWLREFDGGADSRFEKFDARRLPFAQEKSLFWTAVKDPGNMTYGELGVYIEEIRGLGFDTRRQEVNRSAKLSFPCVALVMTLLGLPFAFAMGRRGALVGIGLSMVIAIAYWVLIGVFRSLGYIGTLNVFLAAWGPNLIFGFLGLNLLLRVRT